MPKNSVKKKGLSLHKHKGLIISQKITRVLELIFFGSLLGLVIIFLYYFNSCRPDCTEIINNNDLAYSIISYSFIIGAVLNSLRIFVIFKLFDNNPSSQNGLYLSLICACISLILYGLFHRTVYSSNMVESYNPVFWGSQIILFIISCSSLLVDKKSWHQSNHFVRVRLSITLFYLAVLLISPLASTITIIIVLPFLIFIKPPKLKSR